MIVISRKQAASEGRPFYFTGSACLRGHVSKRSVATRQCTGCRHLADKRKYHRERAKEQQRSRAYQRRHLPSPTRVCPSCCELCGAAPGKRALHLDHDHDTGRFRGWLCHMCNLSLGKFGDSIAGLQRAIDYLRRAEDAADRQ